jgi:hypothetical protein
VRGDDEAGTSDGCKERSGSVLRVRHYTRAHDATVGQPHGPPVNYFVAVRTRLRKRIGNRRR